jgi:hypothetical protein
MFEIKIKICRGDSHPTKRNRTTVLRPAKEGCEWSAKTATSNLPCMVFEGVLIPDEEASTGVGINEGTS